MSSHKITYSTEQYSICHYSRMADAGTKLFHTGEFLGLQFNLYCELYYEVSDILKGIIRRNQYNFIYLPPRLPYRFEIPQTDRYACVSIQLSKHYLTMFAPQFHRLARFLRNLHFPLVLSWAHLPILPQMTEDLEAILYNRLRGEEREAYISARVEHLTLLCLQHITAVATFFTASHPQRDITKLQQIHDYLQQNLNGPCSVGVLASSVEMEEKRLEKGFKLCFGTTVYDFHLNNRLKKALTLLRDTNMHVKDIAAEIGYKNVSNFSEVFKQKYHFSPRAMRQQTNRR